MLGHDGAPRRHRLEIPDAYIGPHDTGVVGPRQQPLLRRHQRRSQIAARPETDPRRRGQPVIEGPAILTPGYTVTREPVWYRG